MGGRTLAVQLRGVEYNVSSGGCSASYSQFRKYIIITTELGSMKCYPSYIQPSFSYQNPTPDASRKRPSQLPVSLCMHVRFVLVQSARLDIRSPPNTLQEIDDASIACRNEYGPTLIN